MKILEEERFIWFRILASSKFPMRMERFKTAYAKAVVLK